jgi:mRNA interferase HigB
MVIITKGAIHEFSRKQPRSTPSLNDWFDKTQEADWRNFQDVKSTFNSVDFIGNDRFVFNVGGNNYRFVAMIHFTIRTLYIRAILTHKEYDGLIAAGRLNSL